MDAAKWGQIKRLFEELVSVPGDVRDRRLDAAIDVTQDVRESVRHLLLFAQGSDGPLDRDLAALVADATEDLPPPTTKRFAIRHRVGAGGMGVVYDAHDTLLNARVALKVLRRRTPTSVDLFKREFRHLVDIQHQNLATLYELFAHEDRWFFTMEFVEGFGFTDYVRQSEALAPQRLRSALTGLVRGVHALHGHGKIHGDLKPGNVRVTLDGRVVVLDFGLVTDVMQTVHRVRAGTLTYMAPELLHGDQPGLASDWYAVGVMLRECLHGLAGLDPDLEALADALLRNSPTERPDGREILGRLGIDAAAVVDAAAIQASLRDVALVGRAVEMNLLRDAARDVNQPVTVVIEGESGIGKSALLRAFAEEIGGRSGTTVFEARCFERESVSFNVFDSLMEGINAHLREATPASRETMVPTGIAELAHVFPVLGWLVPDRLATAVADQVQLRRIAIDALRSLLSDLAQTRQVILLIDDVQWADLDSATMLKELFRSPDPAPIMLVLAGRMLSASTGGSGQAILLDHLKSRGQHGRVQRVALAPLPLDIAIELASRLLASGGRVGEIGDEREVIARQSAGNPFFIHQLAMHLRSDGRAGATVPNAGALTLPNVLAARTDRLPEPARRLLEIVVVAGRPLKSAEAVDAAATAEASPTWLALLRSLRLVRATTEPGLEYVEPYHDALREMVHAAIPPETRTRRHAALAGALERGGASDPEMLAQQYEGAGEPQRAGTYYAAAAGRAAASLAFNAAADLYRRALHIASFSEPERRAVRWQHAEALANAGRAHEAAQVYLEVSGEPDRDGAIAASRAGYHFAATGHVTEAKAAFSSAIRRLGVRIPLNARPPLLALMAVRMALAARGFRFTEQRQPRSDDKQLAAVDMCWFVGTGLGLVELLTGAVFTSYALLLALRSGDSLRIARGLTWEAAIAASQSRGGKRRAEQLFEICRPLVANAKDPYAEAMLELTEGQAAFSGGRWQYALDKFSAAQAIFVTKCRGTAFELATLEGFRLQSLVYSGQLRELGGRVDGLLEEARARGDLYLDTFVRGAVRPLVALAADDVPAARESVRKALEQWTAPGYHLQHALIDQVRVGIELYDGKAEAAQALLDQLWPRLNASHLLFNQNLRAKMLELKSRCRVAVAVASPGEPRYRSQAESAIRRLHKEREPYFEGAALSLRGSLRHAVGDVSGAGAFFRQARHSFENWEMRDCAAVASLAGGRCGHTAEATQARTWLIDQGIRSPERWLQMRLPMRSV